MGGRQTKLLYYQISKLTGLGKGFALRTEEKGRGVLDRINMIKRIG
jgi:hypothetical protein